MRPPDPETGEDETSWLERARTAAAHGPLGHHTHWTSPTHARPRADRAGRPRRARPPRGRVAPRAGPPPHAFLRRRLVHGRVGRPRRRRARLRRLHRDELPASVPATTAAPRLSLDAPGRLALADGRRAARAPDDAFARDGGARRAERPRAPRSRSSTSTSTTPTCSTGAARSLSASRSRCSAAAAPPPTSIGLPS